MGVREGRLVDPFREQPLPPGVAVEAIKIGAMTAERLTPAGASDNVVLHLHGGGYVLGSYAGLLCALLLKYAHGVVVPIPA